MMIYVVFKPYGDDIEVVPAKLVEDVEEVIEKVEAKASIQNNRNSEVTTDSQKAAKSMVHSAQLD